MAEPDSANQLRPPWQVAIDATWRMCPGSGNPADGCMVLLRRVTRTSVTGVAVGVASYPNVISNAPAWL